MADLRTSNTNIRQSSHLDKVKPSSSGARKSKTEDPGQNIAAVKQIKAEAFKSYLSQATQLQQKILEHSILATQQ